MAGNHHHLASPVQVQGLLRSEVMGNAAAESTAATSRRRDLGMNFQKTGRLVIQVKKGRKMV